MKTIHRFALVLPVLLALALSGRAEAQGSFGLQTKKLSFMVAQTAATQDTSTLLGMQSGAVTTVASTKDTSAWFPMNSKWSQPGFTAGPLASVIVYSSGTTDSVGYQVQYDVAGDSGYYITSAQAYLVFGSDAFKAFDAVTSSSANTGSRFRVILWANDTGGVAHTYRLATVTRTSP